MKFSKNCLSATRCASASAARSRNPEYPLYWIPAFAGMTRSIMAASFIMLLTALTPLTASAIELSVPVECKIGKECFIQQYMDHKPGEEYTDYTCGPLSYNEHKGTDIRVPTMLKARSGVPVVAAAPGTVRGIRDGMNDKISKLGDESIKGKECGNGVAITHKNGWETQYCHLLKNSITVKQGQKVTAGEKLGLIGMSGGAEFPHLEFLVREDGKELDPFNGTALETSCEKKKKALWSTDALEKLTYQEGALLTAGFTDHKPEMPEIINGAHQYKEISRYSPALIFWGLAYGLKEGDKLTMILTDPHNETVAENSNTLKKNKAQYFQYIGKINRNQLKKGEYLGTVSLLRDGNTISTKTYKINVGD
jgi:hypothetical protein